MNKGNDSYRFKIVVSNDPSQICIQRERSVMVGTTFILIPILKKLLLTLLILKINLKHQFNLFTFSITSNQK